MFILGVYNSVGIITGHLYMESRNDCLGTIVKTAKNSHDI